MARLPQAEHAVLDLAKLEDYCLDPTHLHGRHKARVFRSALNIGRSDAPWLKETILRALHEHEAIELAADDFGTRWRADLPVVRQGKRVVVRTMWIIRTSEDTPRFVTCWVL